MFARAYVTEYVLSCNVFVIKELYLIAKFNILFFLQDYMYNVVDYEDFRTQNASVYCIVFYLTSNIVSKFYLEG